MASARNATTHGDHRRRRARRSLSVGAVREVEEEILRRGVVVEAHEAVAHFQIVDDDATPPRRLVVVAGHDLRERCRRRERLRLGAEPPLLRRHGDFYAKIVICPKAEPKQGVWSTQS